MNAPTHQVRLSRSQNRIENGDLLLFRRRGFIARAGRGIHSHAAKAIWLGLDLFCAEVREWHGGRIITLESQVARYPGRIDVYATNHENRWSYRRSNAMRFMRQLAGCDYGWWNVLCAAFLHLPLIRWFYRPSMDDLASSPYPPFCSQAVAMAERLGGGVDPVPNLADHFVEPADLARSPFYQYRFTLVP